MKNRCLYIIRFDDMCPTMNWTVWDRIEAILDAHDVKPVLAVIPDCQDESLMCDSPNPKFWERVKNWQEKGYDLAMHGCTHVYTNRSSGLMGITRQSEFVGLDVDDQKKKIGKGRRIFDLNGIESDIWIAPSHSFDFVTLKVLKEHGFKYISDGLGTRPFDWKGFVWGPCQLWDRMSHQHEPGVYTVCNHHYNWTDEDLEAFEKEVMEKKNQITSFRKVVNEYPEIGNGLPLIHMKEVGVRKLKNIVKTILKR